MITYLYISPERSGSTSFYNMCREIKGINVGKYKESFHNNKVRINGLKLINTDNYIENWNYNRNSDSILLDGSVPIIFYDNIIEFKTYISNFVDNFKFVCLIRNPILYLTSIINRDFLNQYKYNKKDDLNLFLNKLFLFLKNENIIFNTIKKVCYSNVLLTSKLIFKSEEIFILPIEQFSFYKTNLSKFLNIDLSNTSLPVLNKANNIVFPKHIITRPVIKSYILKNHELINFIKNDLKTIDNEYGSNLYNIYIEQLK